MATTRLSTVQSGVAGEYLVAGELSRRGYIASVTLRNTRGIDILAANAEGTRSAEIQVKTTQDDRRQWVLGEKAQSLISPRFFYVFVALRGLDMPRFHIVPSSVVADFTRLNHKRWLAERKRDGGARKDSSMRQFRDDNDEYVGRWSLLKLG